MSAASIYRSARGEAAVLALYEKKLANLAFETRSLMIDTRFGHTHVLAAGPQDAPPVMVLTGMSTGAPRTLEWFQSLARDYRLYARTPSANRAAAPRPGCRPGTTIMANGW